MSGPITPGEIDPVIHERARLAIVSTLAVAPEMSFNELKKELSLTDGNLSVHSWTLEEAGYIEIEKGYSGRRPLTTMRLTPKGREAFQRYLATLRRIVEHRHELGEQETGKPEKRTTNEETWGLKEF